MRFRGFFLSGHLGRTDAVNAKDAGDSLSLLAPPRPAPFPDLSPGVIFPYAGASLIPGDSSASVGAPFIWLTSLPLRSWGGQRGAYCGSGSKVQRWPFNRHVAQQGRILSRPRRGLLPQRNHRRGRRAALHWLEAAARWVSLARQEGALLPIKVDGRPLSIKRGTRCPRISANAKAEVMAMHRVNAKTR